MIWHRIQRLLGLAAPAEPTVGEVETFERRIVELEESVARLNLQVGEAGQQAIEANARADRLAVDLAAAQAIQAGECVCGGDPEMHLRYRLNDAELRAARDRANNNTMADQLADMRARLLNAEGRIVYRSMK